MLMMERKTWLIAAFAGLLMLGGALLLFAS